MLQRSLSSTSSLDAASPVKAPKPCRRVAARRCGSLQCLASAGDGAARRAAPPAAAAGRPPAGGAEARGLDLGPFPFLDGPGASADLDSEWSRLALDAAPSALPAPRPAAAAASSALAWAPAGAAPAGAPARAPAAPAGDADGEVYVILFGVGGGGRDAEGIYSLRAVAKEDGLPSDTIVAFEARDDAERYATLLEAGMGHAPTVWPLPRAELAEFCEAEAYRARVEPAGSLLIPPAHSVARTDWERAAALRRGEYGVLDAEPAAVAGGFAAAAAAAPPAGFLDDDAPAWLAEAQDAAVADAAGRGHADIDAALGDDAARAAIVAALNRSLRGA